MNGIRSAYKKGLFEYIERENPDIFALQEIKACKDNLDFSLPLDYYAFFNPAERKGYSGTALFSKIKPLDVIYGLGDFDNNVEGRVITAEFEKFFFVTVYTPNSKSELLRLDYREKWDYEFYKYIKTLGVEKAVIVCGDMNVAHEEIDLKNPDINHFNPGFSDEERRGFSYILDHGFIDTFRYLYPERIEYSWYSYRAFARSKNIGWRIDYFLIDEEHKDLIIDSKIIQSENHSDHMPIIFECDI